MLRRQRRKSPGESRTLIGMAEDQDNLEESARFDVNEIAGSFRITRKVYCSTNIGRQKGSECAGLSRLPHGNPGEWRRV